MSRIYCGVDNGVSGGIACIFEGESMEVIDMPVVTMLGPAKARKKAVEGEEKKKRNPSKRRDYDGVALRKYFLELSKRGELYVILEKAQAFPKQGAVSSYTTGWGAGIIYGIVLMLEVPFKIVSPKTWQKVFFEGMGKDTKINSYLVASRLFPGVEFTTPRGKRIDGRTDAALLAEYCRIQFGG